MQLTAGPIHLTYENGFLRNLTAYGDEVLRMIYFALRDRSWNTARMTITHESVQAAADSFTIDYAWQVDDLGMQMTGSVQVEGQSDGSVTYTFYGKAVNTFWRNRVGLCVLHPIGGLAGQPCRIEHPNSQTTDAVFPDLISPHQPFGNIRAMTWTMVSGHLFSVAFDGDVFETEDQRNWTDASYKTYSTPLDRPFPVEVPAGTEIQQHVTFQPLPRPVSSQAVMRQQQSAKPQAERQFYEADTPTHVGLGHRADGPPLTVAEADTLKTLGPSHLRADVFFDQNDWQDRLRAAQHDANLLNVPLELALFFGPAAAAEARQLVAFVQNHTVAIHSLLLFQTDTWRTTDALLNQVVPVFRQQLPGVLLGGGTDANFVDLNRHRFDFGQVDFVTYSINPQVHAFDDQTLMENVAAQADTVRSARALSGGKPVRISPVTLLPRFNPDAAPGTGRGLPPADPRQTTAFAAEWTRQSLQTLLEAGVESVTYFETHGLRGLLSGGDLFPVLNMFNPVR